MLLINQIDLQLFISENYFTFLLLGGLLIVMFAYRDMPIPATGNFLLIIFILFVMCVVNSIERWATYSPDRIEIRMISSVIHYILQPFVIYLELLIIIPEVQLSGRDEHDVSVRRKKQLNRLILSFPIIFNTVVYLIAPFTGGLVFSFDEDYCFDRGPLGYTIYIVTFIYLFLLLIWSYRFMLNNDRRRGIILFFVVAIAVLTGILEGLNLVPGYIDEAFALGVFLYYMYLITVHESEMQKKLALKELELSKNKMKLLREQIRPHFIFNSLHIIKALIRKDQKKAVEGVENFSDYLRANLDAITSDNLISFEEELEHIEAYVSLALADDSKNITMEYDIGVSRFQIPPLTVEPLVENAILHGVPKGGVVKLSTREEENQIVITVFDNGKGIKPPHSAMEEKGTGIGIKNVQTRLAALCKGTLNFKSYENGTIVTVIIPNR